MSTPFGWSFISGSSVTGSNNGIVIKTSGTQTSGSDEVQWNTTDNILTVSGSIHASGSNILTGSLQISGASSATTSLTVTGIASVSNVSVGDDARTFANASFFRGNSLTIRSTEVIPRDFRGLAYGPLCVATDASLIISTDAILAIEPEANLPSVLSS